jgi:LacI family transcriptional regulator
MRRIPRVVLMVETARGFGREFLSGIARYARLHGPWSFHIRPGDYSQTVPKVREWGGNGIIARIANDRIAKEILAARVPTIAIGLSDEQLTRGNPLCKLSEVSSDPVEVSRLAAEHLLQRRYPNFAFVGSEDRGWSPRREQAFYHFLSDHGVRPYIYRQPKRVQDRVWEREQAYLARWISELPTPLGLFACDDDRGREVLEACTLAGRMVPGEVGVVGVDNDEVFCDLADPPLSSVALNAETAGYRAAELLDGMMRGKLRKSRRIVVEATGVVGRQSTDFVAAGDEIATALKFIRDSNGTNISVDHVVREVTSSRRSLEKQFRLSVGRTIHEEIQLARLERAKRLLLETPYSVEEVARIAGFGSTPYFIQFFLKWVGKTPRRYRVDLAS